MAGGGDAHVDAIAQDLACPGCGYNLRGLRGEHVRCPECGEAVDVAKLVSERWTRPWHRAPGLNTIFLPTAAAVGLLVGSAILSVPGVGGSALARLVFATLMMLLWGWLMVRTWRFFAGIEGPLLALLGHVLFFAYLIAGFIGILVAIRMALALLSGEAWAAAAGLLVLLLLAGVAVLIRRAEQFIAERCIRQYLRTRTTPTTG